MLNLLHMILLICLYSIPELDKQTITIVNNSDTKYTNVITFNNLGTFQAEVAYTSTDYVVTDTTSSHFGEPISAGATSPRLFIT